MYFMVDSMKLTGQKVWLMNIFPTCNQAIYFDLNIAPLIKEQHRLERLFIAYPLTYVDEYRTFYNDQ